MGRQMACGSFGKKGKQEEMAENRKRKAGSQEVMTESGRKRDKGRGIVAENGRKKDRRQDTIVEKWKKRDEGQETMVENRRKGSGRQDTIVGERKKRGQGQKNMAEVWNKGTKRLAQDERSKKADYRSCEMLSQGERNDKIEANGRKGKAAVAKEKESHKLCPVSKACGGCQYLDIPYNKQLQEKQRQVKELLNGICNVYPIVGMEDPFHYRNKVHAVLGYQKGEVISGTYREGTHIIVSVEQCMIEDEKADEIIGTIRGMLKSFKIRTYNEDTGYGFLRHVLVKRGFSTGQIMVVFVTTSPVFPSRNNFIRVLKEKHPEITTIIQNLNDKMTSMVLGDKEKVLYGKGYIEDVLCGCTFRISSKSFYQINPVQTEKLYEKAVEAAALSGIETVIDAYCGIGTIGIIASQKAGRVIGVELNPDAVRDAVANARQNKINNIQFYTNDAGVFMMEMAREGEKADVVFMDPPRSGSSEMFIEAVAALQPKRVVYISCNPETLARDLKRFGGKGYRAEGAWPFDLFPHTGHVETVVMLSHKNPTA